MAIKTLRRHQTKADEIGAEIHDGERDEKIIAAYVTPGGGKTLMASLFAHQLLKRDVSQVLVICPRTSLQTQFKDGFHVPELGLHGGIVVGHLSTRALFRNERAGCVTTYQDIVANPKRWLDFVRARPTLVVLDESHHLPDEQARDADAEERGWAKQIRPIVESAKRCLVMSGSRKRGDGAPRAFVQYSNERIPIEHIEYTRRDAIGEHAVIEVEVRLCDGEAKYWHRFSEHRHKLSKVGAKEASRSLVSLLSDPAYRNEMIDRALKDFSEHREIRNSTARMIIIAQNKRAARSVYAYLKENHRQHYRPILALSDEPDAHRKIARFRDKREGEILVTCQMAHEGLDVPDCTHMVVLTNFRSRPWLEQALSRVTRFDPRCDLPWEEQRAYIYVPDDPEMAQFVAEWIDEQDPRFDDAPETRGPLGERPVRSTFRAEGGEFGDIRHADTYGIFSELDQRRIAAVKVKLPYARKLALTEVLDLGRKLFPRDADVPLVSVISGDEAAE